ncbi:hypothetical protein LOTGIDRAFT_164212 [Lottia gigantea]|uniref:Uncharacterized protein n=1 Tax=Lottia gigantea TaxID=225164 RepID=V4A0S8_LOTGI|nr:hypothetical protein LOTGIDRAFT_164212 [Lottia gigantea]ESO90292.1 hypothetical protein LOTGIDRAFT_164212 [Lottia gigantea]
MKFLWSNLKDILLCRRSNSIADVRATKNTKNKKTVKKKSAGNGHVMRGPVAKATTNQVFNVPVLFATSDGIHIETNESENSPRSKSENDIIEVKESELRVIPKGKHCDVVGPPELDYWRQDTSDYDSCGETEVYSSSQPVSMKQATQDLLTQRSISQPEVCKSKTSHIVSLKDAKKSFAADSGLDLSVSSPSLRQTFNDKINLKGWKSNFKNSLNLNKTWAVRSVSVSPAGENSAQNQSTEKMENSVQKNIETVSNKQDTKENKISESQTSKELDDLDEENTSNEYLSVSQRVKRDSKSRGFSFLELQMEDKHSKFDHVTNSNKTLLDEKNCSISPHIVTHKPPRSAQKKSKSTEVRNLGETFNIPSKMANEPKSDSNVIPSKKGHQRHDTSDSQKSLLGSASSNELASLKEESFPKESLMKD